MCVRRMKDIKQGSYLNLLLERAAIFDRAFRTIDVHSELRRNSFREGGLTGLQRKPLEVALFKIQSIIYFRVNIPN